MALPNAQYIANLISREGNNREFARLDEIAINILDQHFVNFSSEEKSEHIERNIKIIISELYIKIEYSKEESIISNFELVADGETYYIKFFEDHGINLLKKLQGESPEFFEKFCLEILKKLNCRVQHTGGVKDGGIDFIALDLKINNLPYESTMGSKIHLFGQAKRYNSGNHVSEKDLREFIGASVVKLEEYKRSSPEKFGIVQPIIYAFWTTGDFCTNARKLAKIYGLWYLDGKALCHLAFSLGLVL